MTERLIKNWGDDMVLYARLKALADLLNCNALTQDTGTHFKVGDTYMDYGQDWKWTTILANNLKHDWDWQVLNPMQWKVLMDQTMDPATAVMKAYDLVITGDYFIA